LNQHSRKLLRFWKGQNIFLLTETQHFCDSGPLESSFIFLVGAKTFGAVNRVTRLGNFFAPWATFSILF
jgi:hypothetical protein